MRQQAARQKGAKDGATATFAGTSGSPDYLKPWTERRFRDVLDQEGS